MPDFDLIDPETVTETLLPYVRSSFPNEILTSSPVHTLKQFVKPIHGLPSKALNSCLNLVDQNLREHYSRLDGKDWKVAKKTEMSEDGLVYLYYKDMETGTMAAFLSFMITWDDLDVKTNKVLYLYEIHVSKEYQGLRIGAQLIESFHALSQLLNDVDNEIIETDATCLTVFSDNLQALKWYKKLGYTLTDNSPKDKVLRNKKVIKPSYYLMIRYNA